MAAASVNEHASPISNISDEEQDNAGSKDTASEAQQHDPQVPNTTDEGGAQAGGSECAKRPVPPGDAAGGTAPVPGEQPSPKRTRRAEMLAHDSLSQEIVAMQQQRRELRKERQKLQREIKKKSRARTRRMANARKLSDTDLLEVLTMRGLRETGDPPTPALADRPATEPASGHRDAPHDPTTADGQ